MFLQTNHNVNKYSSLKSPNSFKVLPKLPWYKWMLIIKLDSQLEAKKNKKIFSKYDLIALWLDVRVRKCFLDLGSFFSTKTLHHTSNTYTRNGQLCKKSTWWH